MNWKSEKQKEDKNYLFIWIIHVVCMLNTFDTYESVLTNIQLPMVLYVLH